MTPRSMTGETPPPENTCAVRPDRNQGGHSPKADPSLELVLPDG